MILIRRLLVSFLFFTSFLFSQNKIYVEEWVNEPNFENLKYPLVILDFWATWCGPCIQAMPETERLMEHFSNNVLLVYTSDEPSLTVKRFMEKKNLFFYSLVDTQSRNTDLFEVNSLPLTYILNPEGEVIWKGFPTDLNDEILTKFLRIYGNRSGSPDRFSIDEPKVQWVEETFEAFKAKGITIDFTPSNIETTVIEDLQPNFYFNGDLSNLISFIYNVPAKNVQNISSNTGYYTLQCKYENKEKFIKAIEKFIKNKLSIDIDENAEFMDTYVISPSDKMNFFNTNMYDYSENKAKYLASDMEVQIDNASVQEMVRILNKFSEFNFESDGFDETLHDWNIHFKFNQLTLEQLENDYNFKIKQDSRMVQKIIIRDN